jgi:thiol:disulfide interchange protein DsbA
MLWVKRIVFALALAPLAMCQAADEVYKAGEHYDVLPQAVRTANSEKIEINEVFSYSCGHCFNFQTNLHPWVKALPADVDFQSTPAGMAVKS